MTVHVMDINRILINNYPWSYLGEVAVRSLITFSLVYFFLRFIGRRGVRQMSLFELVLILTLGSASGDAALDADAPLLPVVMTFIIVIGLYRGFIMLINHSERFQRALEGKPLLMVENGELYWENDRRHKLAHEEFSIMLRQRGVHHLGQIETAFLEIDGEVSIYYYAPENIRYGLPVFPKRYIEDVTDIQHPGWYACTRCSHTVQIFNAQPFKCSRCDQRRATPASNQARIP
ncbi:DUF421 domain-containing protein [Erwinia sp. CGal63]|uniref:DUF421 domain-containing protein n=1 Tax=Erwinia sp. CGal63 TaxID=2919889 RepID=UPI0030099514